MYSLKEFDEGITVSTSVNWMIKRAFTDYNIGLAGNDNFDCTND